MSIRPLTVPELRNGVYGVIGHRIHYSQSPAIFRHVFDALGWPAVYALFDFPPARLRSFISASADAGIVGFNVTKPYKVRILDHLDRLEATARAVGAVNTVVRRGRDLVGFNTDVNGVELALKAYRRQLNGASAVILGAGGAARAIACCLSRTFRVGQITFAVRSPQKSRRIIDDLHTRTRLRTPMSACSFTSAALCAALPKARLVVNATPVGGAGLIGQNPLPRGLSLTEPQIAFDLVYCPNPTKFLRDARHAGCRTVGGWPMLVGQAEHAFRLWTGRGFPTRSRRALMALGNPK